MSKIDCDNSDLVLLVKKVLEKLKSENSTNINIAQNALDTYLEDCSICKTEGQNDFVCHNMALEKLMRNMPIVKNSVYPWKNYDWDYGNFIDNNYSAKATGSSPNGKQYLNNLKITFKLLQAYLTDPNPNSDSIPGGTDSNSDYPIYGCTGNNEVFCKARNKLRNKDPQNAPYDDKFFKKYSLVGKEASSYFVKVGTCPKSKYKTKDICEKQGHTWTSDECYADRYAFINNTPGLKIAPNLTKSFTNQSFTFGQGFIPSLANDVLSLSPDKIFSAMQGKDVPGYMEVQPCKESFLNMNDVEDRFLIVLSSLIFGIGCFTLYLMKQNK